MPDLRYIYTEREHREAQENREVAERVLRHLIPAPNQDALQAVAEAFIEHFEPERAAEWGHVSYCLRFALRRLVGTDPEQLACAYCRGDQSVCDGTECQK